jgi:ubiquinone/menaquinone biosynthesis C-methylase UbiE
MGATHDRLAKAKGGEPVISVARHHEDSIGSAASAPPVSAAISVKEGYRRWASSYDHCHNPLLALEERMVSPTIPDLAGKQVLDIACGTGRWMPMLAARGAAQVIGVDLSQPMLRVARGRALFKPALVQADCTSLPLKEAHIDFAMCSFAVSHVGNLGRFAAECSRVLKPGAELIVTDLHPDAHNAGWRTGFRDQHGRAEIEAIARGSADMVHEFCSYGFRCLEAGGFHLGEPERTIFEAAGKTEFFAIACKVKAVWFCRFCRLQCKSSS